MPDSDFDSLEPWIDENITKPDILPIIAFDILQILGLISISATLCTVWFSSRIRRSNTWFSYIFSWGFSSIGCLLIIGRQTGPRPGHILCLCQTMLSNASPALNALTFAVFTLDIFLSIFYPSSMSRITRMVLYFVIPYGIFAGILTMVLILGLLNPSTVLREPFGMYCHMHVSIGKIPSRRAHFISAVVICCVTASLILGVRIAIKCRRQWSNSRMLLIRNGTSIGLVLRVGITGAFAILAIGLAVINMVKWNKILAMCTSLALAMLPLVVGVIFASQRDILHALMFWRKPDSQALPITTVILHASKIVTNRRKNEDSGEQRLINHDT